MRIKSQSQYYRYTRYSPDNKFTTYYDVEFVLRYSSNRLSIFNFTICSECYYAIFRMTVGKFHELLYNICVQFPINIKELCETFEALTTHRKSIYGYTD